MSTYKRAARIVRNYLVALKEMADSSGEDHPLHDVGVYGGKTIGEEMELAKQKLADLESKK